MNEQNTKAQEAYKAMLEAHDAEVAANKMAELLRLLNPHLLSLKTIASDLAQTISHIETRLKVIPDPTTNKRKRAKTVASTGQVEIVKDIVLHIAAVTPRSVEDIAANAQLGPRITANALEQLEQQAWVKREDKNWRWIPEAEAEKENGFIREELENGPVMIDDIKEQDDV